MKNFLKLFIELLCGLITYNERNTNVDIDVGSDVAIKMKYTH